MRLETQVLLPVVVTFLIVGAAAFGGAYAVARQDALDDASERLAVASDRLARGLADDVDARVEAARLVADAKAATDLMLAVANESVKEFLIEQNLGALAKGYSRTHFERLSIVAEDGRETHVFRNGSVVLDSRLLVDRYADDAYLHHVRDPRGGPLAYVTEGPEGAPALVVTAPVLDARGAFRGVVRGEVPTTVAAAAVHGADLLASAEASLHDLHGRRLDGPPTHRPPPPSLLAAAASSDAEPRARADEGGALFAADAGVPLALPDGGVGRLVVVSTVPTADVTRDVDARFATYAAALLLILAAVVAVLVLMVRRALRPLAALPAAVGAIGGGAFGTRVEPRGSDELRAIAGGLNRMAVELGRRDEERRRDMAERARMEKLVTLGSMSAGVAHEVNNPLTFMQGNCELTLLEAEDVLADPAASPDARALAGKVEKAVRLELDGIGRIARIVRSLRLISKPQPERGAVDVAPVVDATLALVAGRLQHHVDIDVSVPADLRAVGTRDGLGQVLLNLVLNASEAAPHPGGRIRVLGEAREGRVRLVVEDNGPGIGPEVRERLFTPFFTTKPSGTGLGLSMSQRIVEDAGGRLLIEDRPGGGTRAVIELPAPRE